MRAVRTSMEDNEIMETARKGRILAAVSTENENHGRLTNLVRNIPWFRTVGGATL